MEFPLKASSLSCKNPSWQAFPWRDRICVAYDAACGLSHLHHQTPKAKCIDRGETRRHHETRFFFFRRRAAVQVFHRDIKSPNILQTGLVYDIGDLKSCTELPWTKFPGRATRQWRQWLKFRQVNTQWPCESRWLRFGVLRKTFLKEWCALFNDFVFWECSWSASDCA